MKNLFFIFLALYLLFSCSMGSRTTGSLDADDEDNYVAFIKAFAASSDYYLLTYFEYNNITNQLNGMTIENFKLSFRQDGNAYVRIAYPRKYNVLVEQTLAVSTTDSVFTGFTPFVYYGTNEIYITVRDGSSTGRVMIDATW